MSFYTNSVPLRGGNIVIKATTKANAANLVNQQGFQDFATMSTWYEEDPLKNHLKLQSWFGQQSDSNMPKTDLFQDMLQNDAILEVNGWEGKFTYDLPVETDNRLKTVDDYSDQQYAGMDGSTFKIALNREFAPGSSITCDGLDGDELVISDAEPVVDLGYGFEHTVVLKTNDPDKTYPPYLLEKDIEYFETGHAVSEYGEKLALVHMPEGTSYMTCEFQLGSPQGAESWFTGKADSVDLKGGVATSREFVDDIERFAQKGEEVVMIQDNTPGARHKWTVGSILEMLTIQKFHRNMSNSLMFSRGAEIKTQKGVARYNEGLWHQMRRGFIITYGRPGGITREHIKQARDYVFKANPYKDVIDSIIHFECGTEAYNNVLQLFNEEVQLQVAQLAPLLGADRVLPRNPVSGDLYNLSLEPVRFTDVYLPGIGKVKITENKALNRIGMVDRNLAGMHPNGSDYTTYSMFIFDATDQKYSNNQEAQKEHVLLVRTERQTSTL